LNQFIIEADIQYVFSMNFKILLTYLSKHFNRYLKNHISMTRRAVWT